MHQLIRANVLCVIVLHVCFIEHRTKRAIHLFCSNLHAFYLVFIILSSQKYVTFGYCEKTNHEWE